MLLTSCFIFTSCTGVPKGLEPVQQFNLDHYLGTWFEIVRLDHRFERGLSNVSATYSLRDDGGVRVVNSGYDEAKGRWKKVEGKAYFRGDSTTGSLKVSFFGPFYGGYHILSLDHDKYSYAVVCGPSRDYFWILSRERVLPKETLDKLLEDARGKGFAIDRAIIVAHDRPHDGNLWAPSSSDR